MICRSSSGRAHAGETRTALWEQRQAERGTPLVMSEALARHEANDTALLRCHCVAHGRRQCSALDEVFPQECHVVIAALQQVCDHDAQARDEQRSPAARVASHRGESRPSMDGLTSGLDQQSDAHLGEPQSALGKAMASTQGHGETLTRFVEIPGAPRDNTLVERARTLCMRQRKHSLCSATAHSADSASVLTSLIAPCISAGVNAGESLVALQEHRAAVCAEPAAWLPWTSHAPLAPPEATRRPSRAIWARSGSPLHSSMLHSRADRGTRASAVVGHHGKRPCDTRCIQSHSPWPS
jgi:hypothetical protein